MKISIIGAGVSGLSLGCYLQMQGFQTEIFEKNATPGGLCTSWKRGEFIFDGCIHWLMGSGEANPYYKLWSELIDMKSIRFITHESKVDFEVSDFSDPYGNNIFHLYTDIDRLTSYLLDLAPEDTRQIMILRDSLRDLQSFEIPPMIMSVPELLSFREKAAYIKHLPLLFFMLKWRKVTNYSFAKKLRNPFLKRAFELLFDGDDLPLLFMTLPLACNDKKAAGYPIGGSAKFVSRIEEKYLSLGGKINFNTDVEKIIINDGQTKGLLSGNGKSFFSDVVVSAADWHYTFAKALGGKYMNREMKKLENEKDFKVFYSVFMVSLGVGKTFEDQSHFFRFHLPQPLYSPDGTVYPRMEVHIMNYDPELAPAGKTVVSVKFYSIKGEYWTNLRDSDPAEYKRQKEKFAEEIIKGLEYKLPGITGLIEETDIATPATFYRQTGNWKGSTQAWLPSENLMKRPDIGFRVKGLKGFYYTSHWKQPGGGLPVAIKSARDLAQIICHDHNRKFTV